MPQETNNSEIQLTHDETGHTLHHSQVFSADDQWIVFDNRNADTAMAAANSISIVHTATGEIKELYRTRHASIYGPGAGAATFSPTGNRVIFLRGLSNASEERPYGFTRRTGVAIDIHQPGKLIYMDARDIRSPFTTGALRGGTHAHGWSGDGQWISFTYNDFVMEEYNKANPAVKDLRTVGVMVPTRKVAVPFPDFAENMNGEMFAVIVTRVIEFPKWGTDEIEKAFDECWIGKEGYQKSDGSWQKRAVAFQGNIRDSNGLLKTEIFIADLPEDLTRSTTGLPLQGTARTRPNVPIGVTQRRVTFLEQGVQGPRHWLRSSADGRLIAFLMKDKMGLLQVFAVSPNGGNIQQLSNCPYSIDGQFNFSPDDKYLAYVANNSIYISDITSGKLTKVSPQYEDADKPTGAVVWSNDGSAIAYNRYVEGSNGRYLQIFIRKMP